MTTSTTRPLPANWLRKDFVIAAALAICGITLTILWNLAGHNFYKKPLIYQILGCVVLAAPLVARRRFPLSAGSIQAALFIISVYITGVEIYTSNVMAFLAFYSIGAWSHRRRRARLCRVIIVIAMAIWLVTSSAISAATVDDSRLSEVVYFFFINVVVNAAFFGGAWFFGDRVWQQWTQQQQLEAAYTDIRLLRDELVTNAVELERARISRDLHDVVAHHVTAMSIQTAAARRLMDRNPPQAQAMLQQVEGSARQAIQDLGSIVSELRPEDTIPCIAQIPHLIEQARNSLRDVTWEVIGDIPELSAAAELTCYRVVQEGLTNASKHAGPQARVAVRLRRVPNGIEVDISDDGSGGHSQLPGTGSGLTVMRERVEGVGGSIQAGPKPDKGFLVRAFIPAGGQP